MISWIKEVKGKIITNKDESSWEENNVCNNCKININNKYDILFQLPESEYKLYSMHESCSVNGDNQNGYIVDYKIPEELKGKFISIHVLNNIFIVDDSNDFKKNAIFVDSNSTEISFVFKNQNTIEARLK